MEITAKSTKQQIIDEAVPLIDDLTEQNQNLTEKLNAALILLAVTAALGMLFWFTAPLVGVFSCFFIMHPPFRTFVRQVETSLGYELSDKQHYQIHKIYKCNPNTESMVADVVKLFSNK